MDALCSCAHTDDQRPHAWADFYMTDERGNRWQLQPEESPGSSAGSGSPMRLASSPRTWPHSAMDGFDRRRPRRPPQPRRPPTRGLHQGSATASPRWPPRNVKSRVRPLPVAGVGPALSARRKTRTNEARVLSKKAAIHADEENLGFCLGNWRIRRHLHRNAGLSGRPGRTAESVLPVRKL